MKPKILVIDDEKSIRVTFEAFLTEYGYEVLTAEDYASALELIYRESPDVIFADILLGDHTGIEILKQVGKMGLRCPVVIITGQPIIETAASSVRLGAFDYLPKPIRREMLIRVAERSVEYKRILDEKDAIEADKERYRNHLEAIFRSVTDAIITVDNELRLIQVNDAVKDIFQKSSQDIIGKLFQQSFDDLAPCLNILRQTLEKQRTVREYRIEYGPPGRPSQILVANTSPLKDRNGNSMGAVLIIRDVTRIEDMEAELRERHSFHKIIGKSRKMQDMFRLVEDLADMDTTVLITGESGTGKELIARALHYSGPRSYKPLVTVNCSALSENILESELFGHVKGAFTGAAKDRIGRFQAAHKGTIFLDEIGEISPAIQVKLLRVLQEKEFERVGDSVPIKSDVRVIAATNLDLKSEIRTGIFRKDLYYRLKVVEIEVPPLRERVEDIPLLVKHFLDIYNKKFQKKIEDLTDEAMNTLMAYPWPGNVRELEHAVEHAFVVCQGKTIMINHLPREINEVREPDEAENILKTLRQTDGNKAKAARILGVSRQTLYRKIRDYKIKLLSK
jgi:PAS domain S-box-containing protein